MTKVEVEAKPNIDIEQAAYDAVNLLVNEAKTRYNESLQPLIDLAVECEAPVLKGTLRERAQKSVINREILRNFLASEVAPFVDAYAKDIGRAQTEATACRDAHINSLKAYHVYTKNECMLLFARLESVSLIQAGQSSNKYFSQYKTKPEVVEMFRVQNMIRSVESRRMDLYNSVQSFREKHAKWLAETTVATADALRRIKA